MDDAIDRRLTGAPKPTDEPNDESSAGHDFGSQMVGGLAGLSALHASGWEPPADLEWQDEEDDWHVPLTVQEEASSAGIDARVLAVGAGIFLLALLPRLFNLFFLTNPDNPGLGWYTDVFHHWQIGFLSGEVGFSKGFLTLWDLKGLEYFWGLLHPLTLALLFKLTGSISIVIPRLVSVVSSSMAIVFLFFILKRYFNVHVAIGAVLLVIVNPVAIFADSSGMQEPLGLMLLLPGVLLWPRYALLTGIIWGVAGMARAEYWVFGAGLVAVTWILREKLNSKILLTIGWFIPSFIYAKYLVAKTNNAIYPVYWNFMGNAAGAWMNDRAPDPEEVIATWVARVVLVIAVIASIWILKNRPRHSLFFLLGLGNIVLLGLMWGLSEYVLGFESRVFIGRLFTIPYIYLGVFVSVLLLYKMPDKFSRTTLWIGWAVVIVVAATIQLAWKPVLDYYNDVSPSRWENEVQLGKDVAALYKGGSIAVPPGRPSTTYVLSHFHGIPADKFQSQQYDPFAYSNSSDPLADWREFRVDVVDWLEKLDIQMIIF